jgi:hypothetical protein
LKKMMAAMDVCSLLLLLLLQLLLQLLNAAAASASAEGCSAGAVEVATLDGQPVCEDFSQLNGSLTLPPAAVAAGAATDAAGAATLRLNKRVYAQHTSPTFGNSTLQALNAAPDDLMGKAFLQLAAAEGRDVSYDEILSALCGNSLFCPILYSNPNLYQDRLRTNIIGNVSKRDTFLQAAHHLWLGRQAQLWIRRPAHVHWLARSLGRLGV